MCEWYIISSNVRQAVTAAAIEPLGTKSEQLKVEESFATGHDVFAALHDMAGVPAVPTASVR